GRADLRRAIERLALAIQVPRGARRTDVRFHRITRMRLPLAEQTRRAEEVQLVVDLGALGRRVHEHPPATGVVRERRVCAPEAVDEDFLAAPLRRELDAAIDLDRAVAGGLRDHEERSA